jgi:amino acid adenylation domain-containing protein
MSQPARDAVLALLRSCWSEQDIDPERSLVAQGLGSLAATRLAAEASVRFGVRIEVTDLADGLSLRGLCEWVEAGSRNGALPGGNGALAGGNGDPGGSDEPVALLPLQEAYYVGSDPAFTADAVGCHMYREYAVRGWPASEIRAAWLATAARHPCLRARLTPAGKLAYDGPSAPAVPVTQCTEEEYDACVAATRGRLAARMDRTQGLVAAEITAAPSRATVHLSIDGLVVDGYGLLLVASDLLARVAAGTPEGTPEGTPAGTVNGTAPRLPAAPGPAELTRMLHRPHEKADIAYWRQRLDAAPAAPFAATADGRPQGRVARRRAIERALSPATWQGLIGHALELGISPTALVLAAFAEVIGGACGQDALSLVLTTSERPRLPREAAAVAGPFTSSIIAPIAMDASESFDDFARHLHRLLWADLAHAAVPGVVALRHVRKSALAAGTPVVFTSLLGAVPPGAEAALSPQHALSQTTGIALDHQMWEARGGLVLRWEVADELLPGVYPEVEFARLASRLAGLAGPRRSAGRLSQLQAGYAADRSGLPLSDRPGCVASFTAAIPRSAADGVEAAWQRVVAATPQLRQVVGTDLELAEIDAVREMAVAMISLPDEATAVTTRAELAGYLAGRPRPLGRYPMADVACVTGADEATVHVALDLLVADAPGLHGVVRALLAELTGTGAPPHPAPVTEPPVAGQAERDAYWPAKFASLPPGPATTATERRDWARFTARVGDAARLVNRCREQAVELDWVLSAALADAWRQEAGHDVTIAHVAWGSPDQAGDRSRLAWVSAGAADGDLWARAAALGQVVQADLRHGHGAGLRYLRRGHGGEPPARYPVVYTSCVDWGAPGARALDWITETPGISFDAVCLLADGALYLRADAVAAEFGPGVPERVFRSYRDAVAAAAGGDDLAAAVAGWNDTARPFDGEGPAYAGIEETARQQPGAVAVRWRGGSWTFRELDETANGIAWALRERGVAAGTSVAVVVRRGPLMMAAALGVMKAGGAYVPVEPAQPAARARRMLDVAVCRVAVTSADTESWLTREVAAGIDVLECSPGQGRPDAPPRVAGGDDRAYIIFTSGSTGEPKGVAVRHRAVHNLLAWCRRRYGFGPADTGLCVTSLGFDLSVFDLMGVLGSGGAIYVADEGEMRDPVELCAIVDREPITFWNSAPTALDRLRPFLAELGPDARRRMRLFFLSGDYTPLSLPADLAAAFPSATLVSLGGATEATVWSNYFEVHEVDPEWRSIPYGRPIDNARYHILDERLRHCPPGTEGDLYIAGAVLAEGYVNRPLLTAERFVPEAGRPRERMYRTGDRACYFPDGVIEFRGRADDQVKIRGHRVEAGEIEHGLRGLAGVRDAVVVVRRGDEGEQYVVAYLIAYGAAPEGSVIRAALRHRLPQYMIPTHVGVLAAFPATSNGKLDRGALPWPLPDSAAPALEAVPAPAAPALGAAPVPTAGVPAVPARAAGVPAAPAPSLPELTRWFGHAVAGLLGREVPDDADLWDEGVTSYTVVQLMTRLRASYQLRVPLNDLIAQPTVAGMARAAWVAAEGSAVIQPSVIQPSAARPATAQAPSAQAPSAQAPSAQAPATLAPHPVAGPDPEPALLLDPAAKAEFLAAGHGRPWLPTSPAIPLPGVEVPARWLAQRGAQRELGTGKVSAGALGALLGWAAARPAGDGTRRLYPSAGGTYAVQVYVWIKPGRATGLAAGYYWLDPAGGALCPLAAAEGPDRRDFISYNRPVLEAAAGMIFLVGEGRAIEPLYGADARDFMLLEAGYLGQLLMLAQAAAGLGLCPVGRFDTGQVTAALRLGPAQEVLHSFLLGPAGPDVGEAPFPLSSLPEAAASASVPQAAASASPSGDDVMIYGYASRFAGCVTPEDFWAVLAATRTVAGPVPAARAGQVGPIRFGAFIEDPGPLPGQDLHAAVGDASADPETRLLLEVVREALERAGTTAAQLEEGDGKVGVFVGHLWPDHHLAQADSGSPGGSGLASEVANRISHALGFSGQSIAIDASCASFLAAIDTAVGALRGGQCTFAVVCAANLVSHPRHGTLLADLGLLASDQPTGAYDPDHVGWVVGEGGGALLLGRADQRSVPLLAPAARVRGTATSFAGKTGRFGNPSAAAQEEAISALLRRASLAPGEISYVELAASGAVLSDAAELDAISSVFPGGVIAGTVKPNVGHLEAASGVAQVIKAVLAIERGTIPPTRLSPRMGELVGQSGPPVDITGKAVGFPDGQPRNILVNAVGATGSLAQLIVSAPPDRDRQAAVPRTAHPFRSPGGPAVEAGTGDSAQQDAGDWTALIVAQFGAATGHVIEPRAPLEGAGLTSLAAVEVARALSAHSRGGRVRATLLYEHRTLAQAAEALQRDLGPPLVGVAPESTPGTGYKAAGAPRQVTRRGVGEPVAVIGMAGRFPGAGSIAALWDALLAGRDAVTDGGDRAARAGIPATLRVGGYLDDVEHFDPMLFGIAPADAARMDPQERLMLEVAWEALDDAGYPRQRLRDTLGGRAGVYIGAMHNEYPLLGADASGPDGRIDAGGTPAGIANRVSYHFDLRGPSFTVDAMCSSSLAALHLAVQALRAGDIDLAVVGAVNLALHPNKIVAQARLGMRAAAGRCRAFGVSADGFVPGEGVVAVVLRRLALAELDADPVHGVVRGTAMTHGGKVSGYTVPNPAAQSAAITAALADAGVRPQQVSYLEAHGTGTSLGDPIEVGALRACLDVDRDTPLALGSIKSNIGHLEGAAGLAGVVKVLLQMRHRRLVPSLHSVPANPEIEWGSCRVPSSAEPWQARSGQPLLAGVSSFGAGGANAHVVLESPADRPAAPAGDGPQLLVLSAASVPQLRTMAGALASALDRQSGPRLADVAFTLQSGREALRERWAVIADTRDGARALLRAFADGGTDGGTGGMLGRAVPGEAGSGTAFPATAAGAAAVGGDAASAAAGIASQVALARRWTAGGDADWARHGARGRIVELPSYPFARLRCWIDTADPWTPPGEAVAAGRAALSVRGWRPACLGESVTLDRAVVLAGRDTLALARAVSACIGDDVSQVADAATLALRAAQVASPLNGPGRSVLVLLGGLDPAGPRWEEVFGLLSRMAVRPAGRELRVVHVVNGLLEPSPAAPDSRGTQTSALLAALAAEHRGLTYCVLDLGAGDLDLASPAARVAEVIARAAAAGLEGDLCWRDGGLLAPYWHPAGDIVPAPRLSASGTYLVTGATGRLGRMAARQLARWGAGHVALAGRVRNARFDALVRDLEGDGVRVSVHAGDVADTVSMARLVGRLGQVTGIVHCAGVSSRAHGMLAGLDAEAVTAVARPKVAGLGAVLTALGPDGTAGLEFVVAYSSASAVLPRLGTGVGDYAAANRALELRCDHYRRAGLPAVSSIAWPVWASSAAGGAARRATTAAGLPALADHEGLALLGHVIAVGAGRRYAAVPSAALSDPGPQEAGAQEAGASTALAVSPPRDAPARPGPLPWLVDIIAARVGLAPADIDTALPLGDLGVESVMLARLTEDIERHLGHPVDPGTLLTHPTIDDLSRVLARETPPVAAARPHTAQPAAMPAPVLGSSRTPGRTPGRGAIAIVGMAARFPGAADIEEFWQNLMAGRCAITEVPPGRWDVERLYDPAGGPGRAVSRWGGFIDGIEEFDPGHFGMTDDEGAALDPAIRLMLETSEQCLANAGLHGQDVAGSRTGIYAGARLGEYARRVGCADAGAALGGDQNFIAARLSHYLDARGPNMVIDSACSSALTAVHLACSGLLNEETDLALAAGVDILLDESVYLQFSNAGALSRDGRCRTFDERADGFVPGEGCGVVALKTLERALHDGDRIHAVIEASAVNNDGRTMGLTTPSLVGQRAVISEALVRAGLLADQIGLIEAHGTATRIGDPIELRALNEVFAQHTTRQGFCAIGSVKSNIGHLLSAAGIAGLIKAVLAVEHGRRPPTLFCDRPNPRFDFASSPFFVATEPTDWAPGERRAGVSAFGLGGANAHVIVAQSPAHTPVITPLPPPVLARRRLWLDARPGLDARPRLDAPPGPDALARAAGPRPADDRPRVSPLLSISVGSAPASLTQTEPIQTWDLS